MIAFANKKKIYTATSTNAHFLHTNAARETVLSGLKRLIISIDGLTQNTYESYRKEGSLDKVLEGTQNVIKAKKEMNSKFPMVIWQFLIVRPNEHEIEQLYELAEKYEVDKVALKTAQIYDYENGNELIPENEKYSRYRKEKNGTYTIKNGISNHCWKMWSSCVITWDGKVVPCCFDKDAKHQLGDISQYDFKKVWNSKEYNRFRQQLLKGRKEIDICQNCTEGTKVWA
jgi:radical SAM protein with 4Fe4S-binding SPASM domain